MVRSGFEPASRPIRLPVPLPLPPATLREIRRTAALLAPAVVFLFDTKAQANRFVSESVRQLLGWSPEEVIAGGPGFLESAIHPDHIEAYREQLLPRLAKAKPDEVVEFQARMRDSHGRWRWILFRNSVYRSGRGKEPLQILGSLLDITEQKETETALEQIGNRLDDFLRFTPYGVLIHRAEPAGLVVEHINPAACEILDLQPAQVVGRPVLEVFPGLAGTPIIDAFTGVAVRGEKFPTVVIDYEDGRIAGSYEVMAFQTRGGHVAIFLRDVTERSRAEARLRKEHQVHQVMIEETPDGLGLFHPTGDSRLVEFTMWNHRMGEITGRTAEDINRHGWTNLLCSTDEERHAATRALERAVSEGGIVDGRIQIRHADGRPRVLSISCRPIPFGAPKPQYLGTFRDVTAEHAREIRETALARLVKDLTAADTLKAAANALLDSVDRVVGFDCSWLQMIPLIPGVERILAFVDTVEGGRRPLPMDPELDPMDDVIRRCVPNGPRLLLRANPDEPSELKRIGNRRSASLIFVPVLRGERTIGVFSAQSYSVNAYDQEALEAVQFLVGKATPALERLYTVAALRESERHRAELVSVQSAVLDSLHAHVAMIGADGRILAVNEAWKKFADENNLPLEAHGLGANYLAVCDRAATGGEPGAAAVGRELRRLLSGEIARFEHEYPCLFPDEKRWFILMAAAITSGDDRPGAVLMHLEVTDMHRAADAVRESEERLRTIVQQMPAAAVFSSGNRITLNRAAEQLTGYRSGDLSTVSQWFQKLHGPDWPAVHKLYETERKEGFPRQVTLPVIRADGTRRVFRFGAALSSAGEVWIIEDLTDARRAEQRQRTLAELGHSLSTASTPSQAAAAVATAADHIFGWDACFIGIFDWETGTVQRHYAVDTVDTGRVPAFLDPVPEHPEDFVRRVLPDGPRLILRTKSQRNPGKLRPFGDKARRSASLMFVPIGPAAHPVGLLTFQSYTPNAYSRRDLDTACALAAHCAGAFERLSGAEKLQANQEHLKSILASIDDVVFSFSAGQRGITYVSPAAIRVYGRPPEDFVADPRLWFTMLHPEDDAVVRKVLAGSADSDNRSMEYRIIRPDGSVRWLRDRVNAVRDADGNILRYDGVTTDVTEAKKAEELQLALSRLGRHLGASVDASSAARVVLETAGHLIGWDAAYVLLSDPSTGLARAIFATDRVAGEERQVPAPCEGEPFSDVARIVERGGRIVGLSGISDVSPLRPLGDPERVPLSALFVPLADGENVIGLLTVQSYTRSAYTEGDLAILQSLADHCAGAIERIRTRLDLSEAQGRLSDILDSIHDCVWSLNPDGSVAYLSPAAERVYGRSTESILRDPGFLETIVHPDDRGSVGAFLGEVTRKGTGEILYRIRREDGRIRWIHNVARAVCGPNGEIVRFNGVARDETARREAEAFNQGLGALAARLSAVTSRGEAADAVLESALELIGFDAAWVEMPGRRPDAQSTMVITDMDGGRSVIVEPGEPGEIFADKVARLVPDGARLISRRDSEPGAAFFALRCSPKRSESLMFAPIEGGGRPVGIIALHSFVPGRFVPEDLEKLKTLAGHCAAALERVKAQEDLLDSEVRLRAQFEASIDPILVVSPEGRIVDCNRATVLILGATSVNEVVGLDLWTISPEMQPDGQPSLLRAKEVIATAFSGGGTRFEWVHSRMDGTEFIAEVGVTTVEVGTERALLIHLRDVTEQRLAASRVEASERRFRSLFETLNEVAALHEIVTDASGRAVDYRFLDCNPAFVRSTGISRDRAVGALASQLFGGREAPYLERYAPVARTGVPVQFETRFAPLGRSYIVSAFQPQPGQFATVAADITELRKNEQRLALALEAADLGLYDLNVQTGECVVNGRYATMIGQDPDTFVETNQAWIERLHPEDRERAAGEYRAYIAGTIPEYRVDFRIQMPDGTWRWILSVGRIMEWDDEGNPLRMAGIHLDIDRRKRAEEEREEIRRKISDQYAMLQTIIDSVDSSIFSLDRDLRYTAFNRLHRERMKAIYGTDVEPGQYLLPGLTNEEDRLQAEANLKRVLAGERFTLKAHTGDPELQRPCYELSHNPVRDADGAIVGVTVMATDLTERMTMEENLRSTSELLQSIIDHATSAIYVFDSEGRLLIGNRALEVASGRPLGEMVGRRRSEFTPAAVAAEHESNDRIVLQTGKPLRTEERTIEADGGHTYLSVKSPLRDPQGNLNWVMGISTDITERIRMEQALVEANLRLQQAQQMAHLGYWSWDPKTGEVDWSGEVFELTGRPSDVPLPTFEEHRDWFGGDDWETFHAALRDAAAGTPFNIVIRIVQPDENVRWVRIQGHRRENEPAGLLRVEGTVQDVTESRLAEERIRKALQEQTVLLREVHHRVKNNLQAIIHLIEARREQLEDPTVERFLRELQEQARTMSFVYEQLYQSESIANVEMEYYLHDLAENVLLAFGGGRAIELAVDAHDVNLDVETAMPVGLIVNEILTNALKHAFPEPCPPGARVGISLVADGEEYVLKIADNGVGIPAGTDWSTTRSLGLRLIFLWATHQLGGTLKVDVDGGTAITIRFISRSLGDRPRA